MGNGVEADHDAARRFAIKTIGLHKREACGAHGMRIRWRWQRAYLERNVDRNNIPANARL